MLFPYGKAPLALLAVALLTGATLALATFCSRQDDYDLVFALFAKNHHEVYQEVIPEFEAAHGVRVQMQLVPARGLQSRLQSAFLAGAPVPDVVEILNGSMGYFARGPLKDVGFVDLTERLEKEGIRERMVESRFSIWSSRGHVFAMPHDVHPVTLAYRRDLVEELGIDVEALTTWDEFVRVGRRVTCDLDRDGVADRYMIDLPSDGASALDLLLLQRGGGLFDEDGQVTMDSQVAVETLVWYIHQTRGEGRIAFSAGWGQSLSKAMLDGLALFYFCPDWRTKTFQQDVPGLAGKMAVMPLPAWEEGGRRTSTWGGTGFAITKACPRQELAWEFAKFLYLEKKELGKRFAGSNIIPPVKDAWDLPEFHTPNAYWSNQKIGVLLSDLARETPPAYVTAYTELARTKIGEAFMNAAIYYDDHGDDGLRDYVENELKRTADYVRRVAGRNAFLSQARRESR
ncbi:MAG: extracellular solute-binding protein [Lentisphaerae bacterium]|jgi:arabinosaccharide transport system substrate-binding protein|nr:extracellular solute-binding protein [Lentisphaerota bacterium]MBT4814142.1 extracellular solute-binding protein [Lentisphaerota bacterium]MBT5607367.1 extracellular solute-binding protein [Lentisphaerota bacterium]MBT7058377.1 extracellular solute-binding protein [Lentisphaerota bacterium]MBT7841694.1 extracellular solute-binding protein [Lentisphaerota bacterium]